MIKTKFRIAIIGSQRIRVAKVASILANSSPIKRCYDDDEEGTEINFEFLPCVAAFDSYENDEGDIVKYLSTLEYHGEGGKMIKGSSLAPFFDEVQEDNDLQEGGDINIPGIAAVAVGCGIENENDVQMIKDFFNTMNNSMTISKKGDNSHDILVQCIQPNKEFASMNEENKFYKKLDAEEKERVTQSQKLGPGKMAKFVMEIAEELSTCSSNETIDIEKATNDADSNTDEKQDTDFGEEEIYPEYDTNLTRFACKICRTILLSENELEDPPHTKSKHNFTSRKTKSGSNLSSRQCGSIFLASNLPWMGDTSGTVEGKITCYNCQSKLGMWKWAGCQCSCGTWVTPAIQINLSRVDVVHPSNKTISSNIMGVGTGTDVASEMSPLAALHVAGLTSLQHTSTNFLNI